MAMAIHTMSQIQAMVYDQRDIPLRRITSTANVGSRMGIRIQLVPVGGVRLRPMDKVRVVHLGLGLDQGPDMHTRCVRLDIVDGLLARPYRFS